MGKMQSVLFAAVISGSALAGHPPKSVGNGVKGEVGDSISGGGQILHTKPRREQVDKKSEKAKLAHSDLQISFSFWAQVEPDTIDESGQLVSGNASGELQINFIDTNDNEFAPNGSQFVGSTVARNSLLFRDRRGTGDTCDFKGGATYAGKLNGEGPYYVKFIVGDGGAPGNNNDGTYDTIRFAIYDGSGETELFDTRFDYSKDSRCDNGRIQTMIDRGNVTVQYD